MIECNECKHKWDCPVGYSYGNAACLIIQKEALTEKVNRVMELEKNPELLKKKINDDIVAMLMGGARGI